MKNSCTKLHSARNASVLGLFALIAAPAAMADEKVYPGSQCRPYYSFAAGTTHADNLAIWNVNELGKGGIYVVCPVVRDNATNRNGTRSAKVEVFSQRDVTTNLQAGCTLWNNNASNGAVYASRSAIAAYNGPNQLNVDINTSDSGGTYGLTCWIPPHSAIMSYRIDEY